MPPEIADSDAESDLSSPRRPSASPIPENTNAIPPPSTLEENPFANIEFDQFLSPTQRLSSAVEQQDVIASRSTTSTDKFLQDIAQTEHRFFDGTSHSNGLDGSFEFDSSVATRTVPKRTLSDIEHVQSRPRLDDDIHHKSIKRTKTYGSSRSQISSTASFFDTLDYRQEIEHEKAEHAHQDSEATSTELPIKPLVNPAVSSASPSAGAIYHSNGSNLHIYHQRGATSFLQSNIQNSFVTKNPVRGYVGINMDFRGSGLGLETNANPFGSLSQVSLDGDIDPAETEKFTSLFRHSQQSAEGVNAEEMLDATTALQPSHLKEMATSPIESLHDRNHNSVQPDDSADQEQSARAAQKKPGRKPKSTRNSVEVFQQLQSEDPLDLPQEQYKPRSSRSRANTIDSVNGQISHASQMNTSSDRKRKRSARPEDVSGKHLSSELNLSDPAMIGVPKELYVPRPSKSRSRRVIDDHDEDELQRDEDHASGQEDAHNDHLQAQPPAQALESAAIANVKKKPGRKSKVKRAKTSAAALLKSPDMYDEDDKDCIIVDEMPAKVKMGPLPELNHAGLETKDGIKTSKQEQFEMSAAPSHTEQIQEPLSEVRISIDIPKLPKAELSTEVVAPDSKPKKRGRKPKKRAEVHEDHGNKEAEPEDVSKDAIQTLSNEEDPDARPKLLEKDPNITTPSSLSSAQPTTTTPPLKEQSSSPKKAIHSPLKPSSTRSSTPTSTVASSNVRWVKPRVGLSRRTTIPSLLRKLDRSKEPPKVLERKEKLSKRQQEEQDKRRLEAEDAGEAYLDRWDIRGKDGMLMEWDE